MNFFERLISIDLSKLSLDIYQDFRAELYRKELDGIYEAIDQENFVEAKELFKNVSVELGDNHPEIVYIKTMIDLLD